VIAVESLTVRFGGVTPIDDVTLSFPGGTCGLVGPNGAGKTTFFNTLSGFVAPAAGSIQAYGENLLGMSAHRRARWGLRRTFQQEQVIEDLTVAENVLLGAEHMRGRDPSPGDLVEALDFAGVTASPNARARTLDAGQRRLLEIARAIVGEPRVVLLDEPAAGLGDDETEHLAAVIAAIPERSGSLVILVDHDMGLVSTCCTTTAVLDFGKLIASGPTAEVLRDDQVRRAYLGTAEVEEPE
jgi:branched-chain amino acid transport system ATP-binding protein